MSFFSLEEFACKCRNKHCEGKPPKLRMNPTLIQALNRIREAFDAPLVVTSGYRCGDHNKAVGGATNSQHLLGFAADIKPAKAHSKAELERLLALCEQEPALTAVGNGLAKGFVHVDVRPLRPGTPQKRWMYA